MSVVSVLRLPVRPGNEDAVERAFADLEVFRHSAESGGFRGGRLLRCEGGGHLLVIADWEDAESYRSWLDNPVREELGAHIEPLLAGDVPVGELYESC